MSPMTTDCPHLNSRNKYNVFVSMLLLINNSTRVTSVCPAIQFNNIIQLQRHYTSPSHTSVSGPFTSRYFCDSVSVCKWFVS